MKLKNGAVNPIGRLAAALLCLAVVTGLVPSGVAQARGSGKTVRVGWYESSFNTTDSSGRRSGYAYEYQMKISAYSGWRYSYVTGSWADLMQMLIDGEIDLMSDVSYTDARAEQMLFPELPMGTEEYYLFTVPDKAGISPADPASLNGRRVGVNRGSVQLALFERWQAERGVQAEIVPMSLPEEEAIRALESGEIDAYITPDAFGDPHRLMPAFKIGSSDFYFAVNKDRPDLLEELNAALSRIQDENPYYNQRMFEKHVQHIGSNAFLTSEEGAWLSEHGPIRVGYQDNYLAFCAKDPQTGELTGALHDYLAAARNRFANGSVAFTASAYPTAEAALSAMAAGEVDCVFPANLSSFDGEALNIVMTPPLMRTDIYAVVRQADESIFTRAGHVIVAVNAGNPNYIAFLRDNYPDWVVLNYPTTDHCLKAVSERVADCVLVSSYRYNNISRLCDRYNLTAYSTGLGLDYSFAVTDGETELYSILAKVVSLIPSSTINAALSRYITEDARLTVLDFLEDHLPAVIAIAAVVLLIILALLLHSMRSEKRARELISATEIDELTGLYNRNYFFQYANRMYRERPDAPMDAVVLNIEQFHTINAYNGREFGDTILRAIGNELQAIAMERRGIGGRFGADRFDLYCQHAEDYQALFDRLQSKLNTLAPNASIRLRMGVMPGSARLEPVQQFDRARTACSMARGHYKEHLIIFDEEVRERELRDQRLLADLRHALENYEFEVYYQPKYDIQAEPPRLVSAEALIRWRHPELGMIPPDAFIPLFERNGRISAVDKYVWDQAARQIARWRAQFGVTLPVSVNLSRVDVFDPMLEQTLDNIIAQNGLERDSLKLEVTESAYTENADQVIQVVERLRRRGYVVEMDDFGIGYSSLSMLSAMPVDVLKMDRTFVQNIEHDERDVQLVALILGIAKNLNIPVVAEGVENEAQMLLLRSLGCLLAQGYYFSRPLHPTDFEATLLQEL